MILFKFIFILTLGIDLASCDLSLFPTEAIELEVNSKANLNDQDTNLNIFQQKECPDVKECDKSLIDKEIFCQDHCTVKLSTYQGHCYKKGNFLNHQIHFNVYSLS